jgi:hypothetical protein
MTDPERLLRNPASPLSLLLMRAGAEEKAPAAALRRTAKAIALAAATGAAATSASAAASASGTALTGAAGAALAGGATASGVTATLGVGIVAKWFGIGALGGALAAPLALAAIPTPAPRPARPLATLAADPRDARRSRIAARRTPALVAPATPREHDALSAVEGSALPSPLPLPSHSAKPAATVRPEAVLLAAEVAFVDRGRAALQRGAFAQSLQLLAPYEARFPQQQLLTEVLYLRMETLSRLGDSERARSLAARVIGRGVAGPQAARAREVLGR